MEHGKKGRKFGLETKQRKALMRSLAVSLIKNSSITTTSAKAKELRPYIEQMITRSKNLTVANVRTLNMNLDRASVIKLTKEIALKHKDRAGGYTKILNLGQRSSDGARMAMIQFVE